MPLDSTPVLTAVAGALAVLIALLFRLVGVIDSAELSLRRLAGDARAARRTLAQVGELASAVERDAGRSSEALRHLSEPRLP